VFRTRILGRVVKALDLSPSGHSPRGFEPRSMQCGKPFCPSATTRGEAGGPRVGLLVDAPAFPSIVGVAGVMVSIVAFQAVDPGSIPGPRSLFDEAEWTAGSTV
jgi:hypothetical protein